MPTPFYPHPLLNLSYNKYKGCKVFFVSGKTRNIAIQLVLQQTPRGVGVLLYISEHKSVCFSFVTGMSVHKYSKKFSSPSFRLPVKLFRTN